MADFELVQIGSHNVKLGEPGQHPEGWMILNNTFYIEIEIEGEILWMGSDCKIYRLVINPEERDG